MLERVALEGRDPDQHVGDLLVVGRAGVDPDVLVLQAVAGRSLLFRHGSPPCSVAPAERLDF